MCIFIHSIQQIPISTEFLEHSKRTMWLKQPFHSHSLFRQKIQPVKDASCYGHTISDLSLHNKATLTFLNRRWLYTLTFVFTEQTKIAYYIWGICTNTTNTATNSSKSWRKILNTTANIEISQTWEGTHQTHSLGENFASFLLPNTCSYRFSMVHGIPKLFWWNVRVNAINHKPLMFTELKTWIRAKTR